MPDSLYPSASRTPKPSRPTPEPPPEPQLKLQPEPEPQPQPELDSLPPVPTWVETWIDARVSIAILAAAPVGADADLHISGDAGALSPGPPPRAHRILAGCSGLARVDRRCAALDRQCHQLCQGAVRCTLDVGFYLAEPLMVIVAGYTLRLGGVDWPRRVLRLAVPLGRCRSCSTSSRARCACRNGTRRSRWRSACGWASTSPPRRCCVGGDEIDRDGGHVGDRAVQDGDHHTIHARLALCALCRCSVGHRAVLGAGLLPLPVSTGWRARIPRSAAPAQSAQASSRMRQSLPLVPTRAAPCGRSSRRARSSRPSAFSASIARSNITTTSDVRRWCGPPGCAERQSLPASG